VILYNFFQDSTLDEEQWNILHHVFVKNGEVELKENKDEDAFVKKYSGMCAELKRLYTALTRTKDKLFIYETDLNNPKFKPMLQYWKDMNCVRIITAEEKQAISKEQQQVSSKFYQFIHSNSRSISYQAHQNNGENSERSF